LGLEVESEEKKNRERTQKNRKFAEAAEQNGKKVWIRGSPEDREGEREKRLREERDPARKMLLKRARKVTERRSLSRHTQKGDTVSCPKEIAEGYSGGLEDQGGRQKRRLAQE